MRLSIAVLTGLGIAFSSIAPVLAQGVDSPITRSFYWFRFVAGKDVREGCEAGGPDHFRLVYNAIYTEQVRSYDIVAQPGGGTMTTRVFGEAGVVNNIVINDVVDILGPWRGVKSERSLTPAQMASVVAALEQSGALQFPAKTMQLPSNDFYWAVSACRAGRFTSTAFHHPTGGFEAVTFDKPVFALDDTGIAVNEPRKMDPSPFRGNQNRVWQLRVTKDGIQY